MRPYFEESFINEYINQLKDFSPVCDANDKVRTILGAKYKRQV